MLMTYAIARCYANSSDSDSGSDIMKMVKVFYVNRQAGRQARARLNSIRNRAVS